MTNVLITDQEIEPFFKALDNTRKSRFSAKKLWSIFFGGNALASKADMKAANDKLMVDMGNLMDVPSFYDLNILMAACDKDRGLFKKAVVDIQESQGKILPYLKKIFENITEQQPPEVVDGLPRSWEASYNNIKHAVNKNAPLTREEKNALLSGCSFVSMVLSKGDEPKQAQAAYIMYLISQYFSRFQEIIDKVE